MQQVIAILRRELAGSFDQPTAYIVLTVFVGVIAVPCLVLQDVLAVGVPTLRVPFFWTGVALLFVVPALTMRLIAEERRTGSLEILQTLPVTPTQLVLGKWLAAVALVGVALGLTAGYPAVIGALGGLDPFRAVAGYLGLFMMGGAFAAVGIMASALTRHQVIAFLVAFALLAVPWAVGYALSAVEPGLIPVVQYLTFEFHLQPLARGIIDTRSLVFFGALTLVALRLAVYVLHHERLRA